MLHGARLTHKCDSGVKLNNYLSYVHVYIYIDNVSSYFPVILYTEYYCNHVIINQLRVIY